MSEFNQEYVDKCVAENPSIPASRFKAYGIPSLVNGVRVPYSGIKYNSSSKGMFDIDSDKRLES